MRRWWSTSKTSHHAGSPKKGFPCSTTSGFSIDWLDPSSKLSDFDPAAVDLYADTPFGDAPPIVIDGEDRVIIDGYHRFNAALRRGDPTIRAYVGVKPRADWQPFEEGVTPDPSSVRYREPEEPAARKPGWGAPR